MDLVLIFYSVLGTLFYEAIRLYRCFATGSSAIPDVGLSPYVARAVYVGVIVVFVVVAATVTVHFEVDKPYHAFFLGVGIPTGSRLLTPASRPTSDQVDDFASADHGPRPTTAQLVRAWLQRYNV